ncbi:Core-2/I-Branching enzyme [compost metagenome]
MGTNDRRISLGQYFVEDCGEIKILGERKPFEDYFALGIDAYRGSQWKIISRTFAEFSVSSPLAFDMQDYFRYALIPDELYFPTLLMNSDFARTHISRNYRFILYKRRENGFSGPVNLTIENIQDLILTDDLFARKFDDVDVVESLLERLAPLGGAAATLLKQLS